MRRKSRFVKLSALVLLLALVFGGCSKTAEKSDIAMGTVISVRLYGTGNHETAEQIISDIKALEKDKISIHTDSELQKINQSAGREISVSEELYQYLFKTAQIYENSEGKLSVTAGALTALWGFDDNAPRVPSIAEIETAMENCGDNALSFLPENRVLLSPNYLLNLGSVGKGIACDRAFSVLQSDKSVTGAVVFAGGSLCLYGENPDGGAWRVGIRDPHGDENAYFAVLSLPAGFVSTSGSYEKTFTENGKSYHHILDLTTGRPAESGLVSVTVFANNGLLSDALSTLCFTLGYEKSLPILEKYSAEAVFVTDDNRVFVTNGLRESLTVRDSAYRLVQT